MTDVNPIITGVLDHGDRFFIAGPPKSGRSFLAAQLALAIAAGRGTLEYRIPAPRRVVFVQYQSAPHHISRRLSGIADAMGVAGQSLSGYFKLLKFGLSYAMAAAIAEFKPDVVVIDTMEDASDEVATVNGKIGCALLAVREDREAAIREGDAALVIAPNTEYDNVAIELKTMVRHGGSPRKQYLDWERDCLVARQSLKGGMIRW